MNQQLELTVEDGEIFVNGQKVRFNRIIQGVNFFSLEREGEGILNNETYFNFFWDNRKHIPLIVENEPFWILFHPDKENTNKVWTLHLIAPTYDALSDEPRWEKKSLYNIPATQKASA